MTNPARLNDLAARLLDDGALSPEEERELGLALQQDPAARQLVLSYLRLEGGLIEQARAGLLATPAPARSPAIPRIQPLRRPPSIAAWVTGLTAAAILLGLLLLVEQQSSTPQKPLAGRSAPMRPEPRPDAAPTAHPQAGAPDTRPPRPAAPAETLPTSRPDSPSARNDARPPAPPTPPVDPAPIAAPAPEEVAKAQDAVLTEVILERAEGEVAIVGPSGKKPGSAGDLVRAGQGLETGSEKSLAVLSLPDGTRIEARGETVLRDILQKSGPSGKAGKSLTLSRGTLWADVRPQPADRPLVIHSPKGEVRVVGTVFTVRMDGDPKGSLRLEVQEGKVRFTRSDGKGVDVAAGHSVTAGAGADLTVLRSQEEVLSFQDGRFPTGDYSGTRDTQLMEKAPQTTYGGAKILQAEADDPKDKKKACWPLLRWDLSGIAAGSKIHAVSVTLHITEPSGGQGFYFFESGRAWTESEATWKSASTGNLWRFPGSLGAQERWPMPLGTVAPIRKGEYTAVLGDAGVAVVQSWINTPASNLGLQIAGSAPGPGFHFYSREAAQVENRPRLTIVYTPRK